MIHTVGQCLRGKEVIVEHTLMRINKVSCVSIHTCRFIHVRLYISFHFIVINMKVTF